jgi:dihydrofolate reductase
MTKEDGQMRKVLLQMGLSVDGIVAGGPQGTTEAGEPPEDEAVRRWKVQSVQEVGTHIMGRVTYEQMAGHWPYNGPAEYADPMNNIPKVVFSKTLTKAETDAIAAGLIDEYRLVIRPVALGSGMPLFKDLLGPLRRRLVDSKAFTDGTAIWVYEPVRNL